MVSPPDLRALAQREFAVKGRYQLAEPPLVAAAEPWWLQAWNWIYKRWQTFWDLLFARVRVGPQGVASFGDVLLVLVGILMIFVVVRLLRNLQIERSESGAPAAPLQERQPTSYIVPRSPDRGSDFTFGFLAARGFKH